MPTSRFKKTCDLCPLAKSFILARTLDGRPVPGVYLAPAGKRRFTIWIQARQHGWETGSSWVGRGFMEWLVSSDPAAIALRQETSV